MQSNRGGRPAVETIGKLLLYTMSYAAGVLTTYDVWNACWLSKPVSSSVHSHIEMAWYQHTILILHRARLDQCQSRCLLLLYLVHAYVQKRSMLQSQPHMFSIG